MKKAWVLTYPLSAQRRLIRLVRCLGWSESSLGAHAILLVLSWRLNCVSTFILVLKHVSAAQVKKVKTLSRIMLLLAGMQSCLNHSLEELLHSHKGNWRKLQIRSHVSDHGVATNMLLYDLQSHDAKVPFLTSWLSYGWSTVFTNVPETLQDYWSESRAAAIYQTREYSRYGLWRTSITYRKPHFLEMAVNRYDTYRDTGNAIGYVSRYIDAIIK